ncbi:hypothetical protein [Nocardiopsis sp. HUAS JQ3]|uniref:hypothetical protein n=1 Tax=Nocardiopsis sp. HUAS JQ3 TaxID=3061629 RepID=UPI0023A9B1AB|nr:hypothetical protein [Nocardiopsis sp. HUAS JQ3]WDZ91129.1 hypothetical protein PV789_00705 [Nocardiopsis sp. HUAS JQ3]
MHHFILYTDLWLTDDQVARYRLLRELPPDAELRPALAQHVHEEVAGLGALDDLWESRTR